MNTAMRFSFLLVATCILSLQSACAEEASRSVYKQHCASCHGQRLEGGMAGSLLDDEWLISGDAKTLAGIIKHGNKDAGMPAWGQTLSNTAIRGLVIYINEQRYEASDTRQQPPSDSLSFEAEGYKIHMDTVTKINGKLWAVEPLPGGQLLITERSGKLWLFDGKDNQQIKGLPEVWDYGQGGLMDVALHPDYANNGWIYLTFSDTEDGASGITRVVRGKLKGTQWQQQETIYQAPEKFHGGTRYHFGSRMVFSDGYLYFGIGDRGSKDLAQKLNYPNGKIFRLHDDGRIPKDNPFVGNKKALPEIYSYGHRNPQGMALNPVTKTVWASEHGPRGGDEVNTIQSGRNYGWPVITYGMNYSGTPITHLTAKEGMEQPQHYWVPSIAIAGIDFYQGDLFKEWQGKLLVSGMKKEVLQLLDIEGDKVTAVNTLLKGQGRVRDVKVAADGSIYVVLNGGGGRVVRLVPN